MSFAKSAIQVSTQTNEGKYATALFRAANRQSTFRQVENDIFRLKSQIEHDGSKLSTWLQSPLLSNSKKYKLLLPIVSKYDQSGTVHKFIDMVAANGRLAKLNDILDSFVQICESQKQCSYVKVTIAKVLLVVIYLAVGALQTGTG